MRINTTLTEFSVKLGELELLIKQSALFIVIAFIFGVGCGLLLGSAGR